MKGAISPGKLAEQVAKRIEQDIVAGNFKVGKPLGTESELSERYGVSRWALREAVAVVQNDGLVHIRRGRGGGIVVNADLSRSLAAALCNFLLYMRLDVEQLIETRRLVDRLVYAQAAARVDQPVSDAARALLSAGLQGNPGQAAARIYDEILKLSDNPFISVFGLALSKLMQCLIALMELPGIDSGEHPALSRRLYAIRVRQLECIIGVDANGASEAANEAATLWAELFAQTPTPLPCNSDAQQAQRAQLVAVRIAEVLHYGQGLKPSLLIATRIMLDLMREQLPPDGLIASEAELTVRYKVPRNVLRESIRILERYGFVRSGVGRNGGIRVGRIDRSGIVERSERCFSFLQVTAQDTEALSRELRVFTAELAIRQAQRGADISLVFQQINQLRSGIEHGEEPCPSSLFAAMARVSGNQFLVLFEDICGRIDRSLFARTAVPDGPAAAALLSTLAQALERHDKLMARRSIAQLHALWIAPY